MVLKTFLENEFGNSLRVNGRGMSDSEIKDFCNYNSIYIYDENELRREFVEDGYDEFLMGFVNIKDVAEACNYTCIDEDLFIDNLSVHDFQQSLLDYYDGDFGLAILEWYNQF